MHQAFGLLSQFKAEFYSELFTDFTEYRTFIYKKSSNSSYGNVITIVNPLTNVVSGFCIKGINYTSYAIWINKNHNNYYINDYGNFAFLFQTNKPSYIKVKPWISSTNRYLHVKGIANKFEILNDTKIFRIRAYNVLPYILICKARIEIYKIFYEEFTRIIFTIFKIKNKQIITTNLLNEIGTYINDVYGSLMMPVFSKGIIQIRITKKCMNNKKLFQNCFNCYTNGQNKKFQKCKSCKIAHYCSKKCQKIDWNMLHRVQCKHKRLILSKTYNELTDLFRFYNWH